MTPELERDINAIYTALTSRICTTHDDIASATGLPLQRVSNVVTYIRKNSDALGWSVPAQPAGWGDHLYLVVEHGAANLTDEEYSYVVIGQVSSMRHMATRGENQGRALALAAPLLRRKERRIVEEQRKLTEGAAVMARRSAELLVPSIP
jgi:hypothetical protein